MADKRGLGLLGFLFGGITAAVTVTAFLVVQAHIGGHLQFSNASLVSQVTVGYR
jgi:ABC-type Co2+ transport system permease subunit